MAHNIDDILSAGDGPADTTLQEVATTNGCSKGSIGILDGITQTGKFGIAVDAAVYVILIENNDAFLFLSTNVNKVSEGCTGTQQQHGYEVKEILFHRDVLLVVVFLMCVT